MITGDFTILQMETLLKHILKHQTQMNRFKEKQVSTVHFNQFISLQIIIITHFLHQN